jgi:hypothetical protein
LRKANDRGEATKKSINNHYIIKSNIKIGGFSADFYMAFCVIIFANKERKILKRIKSEGKRHGELRTHIIVVRRGGGLVGDKRNVFGKAD